MAKNTTSHGGFRPGAGRKANSEPSVRVSVPASTKDSVIDFVKLLSDRKASEARWPESLTPVRLADNPTSFRIPLFAHPVQAGFPSPADDYVADSLDLNDYLVPRKEATFMLRVQGESMVGASINEGDILIVDRSLTPKHGSIVVAAVDREFTVKRLEKIKGKIRLIPENPKFEPIDFKDEQELQIWGVVTNVIHSFKT